MMKKLLMVSCLALAVSGAYAQNTNTNNNLNGSNSTSTTNANQDSSNRTTVDAVSGSSSISGSNSTSNGNANSQGNNTNNIIFPATPTKTETTINQHVSGTQTLKNVPSVNGPPLTTSNDTCMGSTSGSINGPGFGVGLGTTWTDDNCVMLKNSRELWNMGMKAASMALMCTDPRTRSALEVTGYSCPNHIDGSRRAAASAPTTTAAATEDEKYKDPIIRARLGLAPLEVAKK